MDKNKELADLMFPDINETVEELEKMYPKRNLPEGAKVIRFAPSPTGFLHTGALYTSIAGMRLAKESNGIYYLRIEDTDRKREVAGSIKAFTDEMKEFGIVPDEGVVSEDKEIGNYGPYTQSKREKIYKICAKFLVEKGMAYPCFCTAEMVAATKESQEKNKVVPGYYGVYAKCRNISVDESIERVKAGERFVTRFRSNGSHLRKVAFIDEIRGKIEMAENDLDIVIVKADGLPTYHFAHVVDDHFMRTTLITRGEEWLPSSPVHLELFRAMGFEAPKYAHFSNVMKKDGDSKRKLSKRKDQEAAVSFFLKEGYPVDSVIEYILTLINSDYEPWRMKNPTADKFDFEVKLKKMGTSGALFDIVKLNDVSKELIAKMDSHQVLENVLAWAKKYNEEVYQLVSKDTEYARQIFALERDGAKKIRKDIVKWEEIPQIFFYFFDELFEKDIAENGYAFSFMKEENTKISSEMTKKVLDIYSNSYDETLDKEAWFNQIKEQAASIGFCTDMKEYKQNPDNYIGSTADYTGIIRIALTNRQNSPDIYQIMQLLGKDKTVARLKDASSKI
ncbi:MAG: glutamate--tRNA ligase [Clostridia bacterium]|nr:glutamate--tRNA ligase [Clostridia bacterium]